MSTISTTTSSSHWLHRTIHDVVDHHFPKEMKAGSIRTYHIKLCIFVGSTILLLLPHPGGKLELPVRDMQAGLPQQSPFIIETVFDMLKVQIREDKLAELQFVDFVANEPLLQLQSSSHGKENSAVNDRAELTVLVSASTSSVAGDSVVNGVKYGPVTWSSFEIRTDQILTFGHSVRDEKGVKGAFVRRGQYMKQLEYYFANNDLTALHNYCFQTAVTTCSLRGIQRVATGECCFLMKKILTKKNEVPRKLLHMMPVDPKEARAVRDGARNNLVKFHGRDGEGEEQYEVMGALDPNLGLSMYGGLEEYHRVMQKGSGRVNLVWTEMTAGTRII